MSERPSEEGQVKFRDVSVCFSEEEWKTLYQWQKDFYQNVIKEIHQALFLMEWSRSSVCPVGQLEKFGQLPVSKRVAAESHWRWCKATAGDHLEKHCIGGLQGYQIVHPDNLLQVYRGKDSYVPVSRAGEHTELQEPGSSSLPEVIPDVLFRISHKEESDCGERQHSDEAGSCNSASSCFPVVTAAFSLTKEQELQLYPALQQNLQRREKSDHPSTGFPVWESAVSLENEDKSARFLKGFPGAGEEGHAETRAGRKAVPEVVAADIKEEEKEVSFSQQQDCRVIDVSGAEGGERVNSLKKVGEPLTCCKTEASEKAFLKREHPNMFQSSYEGSRSPLWSDNCLENRGGQVAQFERDTSHTEYIGEDQEIAKVLMSPKENENECDRWNSKIINGLLYLTKKKALHNPSEYNQNNSPQSKCASNLAKLPPVRAFPCSDCEKSFFKMPQLVQHYRTHTGERPYACSFCDKTYNRSYHLKDHIRTHTGERPHMCLVCQQTFTYKSHFNSHRRKKKHYLWDAN